MSRRVEAACAAIGRTYGADNATKSTAEAALAAADAVMFSEEAVDRVAKALFEADRKFDTWHWEKLPAIHHLHWRKQAHAVIAALKGDRS